MTTNHQIRSLTGPFFGIIFWFMNLGVLYERVQDAEFPAGYYYAQHMPTLGLTTHGLAIGGAREAALDLANLWLAGKNATGESCPAAPVDAGA